MKGLFIVMIFFFFVPFANMVMGQNRHKCSIYCEAYGCPYEPQMGYKEVVVEKVGQYGRVYYEKILVQIADPTLIRHQEKQGGERPVYNSLVQNRLNDEDWINLTGENAAGIGASQNWGSYQFQLSQDVVLREKTTHLRPVGARQDVLDSVLTFQGVSRLGRVARVGDNLIPEWIFVSFSTPVYGRLRLAFFYDLTNDRYELAQVQPTKELENTQDWLAPTGIYLQIAVSKTVVDMAPSGDIHPQFKW